jgi:hypothetical protein
MSGLYRAHSIFVRDRRPLTKWFSRTRVKPASQKMTEVRIGICGQIFLNKRIAIKHPITLRHLVVVKLKTTEIHSWRKAESAGRGVKSEGLPTLLPSEPPEKWENWEFFPPSFSQQTQRVFSKNFFVFLYTRFLADFPAILSFFLTSEIS